MPCSDLAGSLNLLTFKKVKVHGSGAGPKMSGSTTLVITIKYSKFGLFIQTAISLSKINMSWKTPSRIVSSLKLIIKRKNIHTKQVGKKTFFFQDYFFENFSKLLSLF